MNMEIHGGRSSSVQLTGGVGSTTGAKGGSETNIDAGDFTPPSGSGARSLGMVPPSNVGDMMAMVIALKTTLEETSLKTGKEQAESIKEDKIKIAQERLEMLQKSREASGKSDKGGLAGDIFGWVASAAMIVAGAILVATGVGTAVGVALLAGGITMFAMTTLNSQALGKAFGLEGSLMDAMVDGMAGWIGETFGIDPDKAKLIASAIIVGTLTAVAVVGGTLAGGPFLGAALATQTMGAFFTPENLQAMGVSEEAAPWASMGISIGLSIIGIASGFGASKAISSGADMSARGATLLGGAAGRAAQASAQTAATATKTAATTAQVAAKMSAYVAAGIAATATVGQGGAQIYTAVKTHEAENLRADVKDLDAFFLQLQQMFQDQADKLQEIVERMQENASVVMSVLNQMDTTTKRINAI